MGFWGLIFPAVWSKLLCNSSQFKNRLPNRNGRPTSGGWGAYF
jgi:hypothetical protein